MMFKLAEALGRLALAGREMTRLAGFTARVSTLMTVLNDLQKGKYERTMVTGMERAANGNIAADGGEYMHIIFMILLCEQQKLL